MEKVDADLKAPLGAPIGLRAAFAAGPDNDVLRDKPALDRVADQGAEEAQCFFDSGWRAAFGTQLVLKLADAGSRELRELNASEERHDMQLHSLFIGLDRRAFQPSAARLYPLLSRRGNRHAGRVGRVDTLADFDIGAGMIGIGILFALKGFQPALASLIDVINDPSLQGLIL